MSAIAAVPVEYLIYNHGESLMPLIGEAAKKNARMRVYSYDMNSVWQQFVVNAADWLTFLSTTVLSAVTVYFAWRSRQLERNQLRQINREFDRDIVEAETEIERARLLPYLWDDNWSPGGGALQAFQIYERARANYTRPDLPRLTRILAFHLPEVERSATEGVLKLYAALDFLDMLLAANPRAGVDELRDHAVRAEAMIRDAKRQLDETLAAVKGYREGLRRV